MKKSRAFAVSIISLMVLLLWVGCASAAAVDQMLALAKKEGTVEFYGPLQVGVEGAQKLGAAFNKKYGLNITVKYTASEHMTKDVGKLVSESAAGRPPEWDSIVLTDTHHAILWLRKLHQPFEYRSLGTDTKLIHYDNGTVSFANQFALPAYNKKLLSSREVPKRWEDLLGLKWKGGKLGMSTATPAHLASLAAGSWNEEKTTKYVKAVAQQGVILGRLGELYNRLLIGEIQVAVTLTNTFIYTAEKQGAPIVFAEGVEPVISPAYHVGVPKGARHPTVGHLFSAFLTTGEAQEIWEKYVGHTSAFIPGTPAYKFAQGKQVVYLTQDKAQLVDRLTIDYGKIVGFP